jgi:hypothetical protein
LQQNASWCCVAPEKVLRQLARRLLSFDTVYGDGVIAVRTGIGVWERHREGGRSRLVDACPGAKLAGSLLPELSGGRAVHNFMDGRSTLPFFN